MAFQVSPGVNTSEIDLTTVVPAVSTSTGAIAGLFQWGPVEEIRQVSNELDLVNIYGKPDSTTAGSFFTAANFLAYGNDLRVCRAANTYSKNAFAPLPSQDLYTGANNTTIKNQSDYENSTYSTGVTNTMFAARYPGAIGNSLKVEMFANGNTSLWSSWSYSGLFDKQPATSHYISANFKSNANDELHIVVVDEDGSFTGTPGTVLEKFANLSKATNAKDESGQNIFYKEYLLRNSKYIYWSGTPEDVGGLTTKWDVAANTSHIFTDMKAAGSGDTAFSFVGGSDLSVTDGAINTAYDKFAGVENIDISLIMTAAHSNTVALHVIDLAQTRADTVAFVSPLLANTTAADPTTSVVNYRKSLLSNTSSSYAVMDSGWKYQYDKYNDLYRWMPLNGDIAGLCARTDTDRDPWFSPAGLTRGQIKNVIKLSYNPNKANRDELYKNDINPVVSSPGEGTLLFGDKTLLGRPSAFDRINVRRLFIVLEKSISRAAKSSLFEFNDEFTRAQFVNLVEPFLRTVQGRRGIYDFRVVCDETNNTPEVVDRNEFVGDIYIKPAKSINFIQLNFVAVRTGVAFEEIVGKF